MFNTGSVNQSTGTSTSILIPELPRICRKLTEILEKPEIVINFSMQKSFLPSTD